MGNAPSKLEPATGPVLLVEPVDVPGFEPDRPVHLVSRGLVPRLRVGSPPGELIVHRRLARGATFVRFLDLPGHCLDAAVLGWWPPDAPAGTVAVDGHLRLRQPRRGQGSWSIPGRMRRPLSVRLLPVEIELWPHHSRWTRLVLFPRADVRPDWAYFRYGNRSVDRFAAALLSAAPDSGG